MPDAMKTHGARPIRIFSPLRPKARGRASGNCGYDVTEVREFAFQNRCIASRLSIDAPFHDLRAQMAIWADAGIKSVKPIGDAAAPAPISGTTYAGHRFVRDLDGADICDAPD